jgi:hypothetical protein
MRALQYLAIAVITALPVAAFAQTAPQTTPQTAPAAAPITQPSATTSAKPQEDPAARARWEKFRAACGADLQLHCATVTRGTEQGRNEMRQCIDTNKAKFSAGCVTALKERDAERAARKDGAPAENKPKG